MNIQTICWSEIVNDFICTFEDINPPKYQVAKKLKKPCFVSHSTLLKFNVLHCTIKIKCLAFNVF